MTSQLFKYQKSSEMNNVLKNKGGRNKELNFCIVSQVLGVTRT